MIGEKIKNKRILTNNLCLPACEFIKLEQIFCLINL